MNAPKAAWRGKPALALGANLLGLLSRGEHGAKGLPCGTARHEEPGNSHPASRSNAARRLGTSQKLNPLRPSQ